MTDKEILMLSIVELEQKLIAKGYTQKEVLYMTIREMETKLKQGKSNDIRTLR